MYNTVEMAAVKDTSLWNVFVAQPGQFYPFGSMTGDERAQRTARLILYSGILAGFLKKNPPLAFVGGIIGFVVLSIYGRPTTIDPRLAGTVADPNPAGNSLVGDVRGRDSYARIGGNLDKSTLLKRMQNPFEAFGALDRQIAPALSPLDAPYLQMSEPSEMGLSKWTEFAGGPGGASHGGGRQLGVPPRGG